MKKGIIILTFMCTIVSMTLLIGCNKTGTDTNSNEDNIITIEKSDEAKEYEEKILSQDGSKESFNEENFETTMQLIANRSEQTLPECDVENQLDCEKFEDSNVYTISKEGYENIILYIHGGAWAFEISEAHVAFCDDLATRLNARVYMPLYPLAPESDSEDTYKVIEGLYKEIIKEGKNVYVMGDSAGGNITLGLMYTIKKENLTKPNKIVVMAPCSDMSFTNDEIKEVNKTDPSLEAYGCLKCAKLWAGKDNLKDPKNSAVYADVKGYPDTMIIQGTNDILCPDNMILYEHLKDADVNVTLVKGEGLWHVFGVYPIPEREEVLGYIEKFCKE